jgi:dTDP-4-amino-4,6-dideoxygalactose transaminase
VPGIFFADAPPALHQGAVRHAGRGSSVTEAVARRTIALPFHSNLRLDEVEYVVEALKRAVM